VITQLEAAEAVKVVLESGSVYDCIEDSAWRYGQLNIVLYTPTGGSY
jgi:hypothetical protein